SPHGESGGTAAPHAGPAGVVVERSARGPGGGEVAYGGDVEVVLAREQPEHLRASGIQPSRWRGGSRGWHPPPGGVGGDREAGQGEGAGSPPGHVAVHLSVVVDRSGGAEGDRDAGGAGGVEGVLAGEQPDGLTDVGQPGGRLGESYVTVGQRGAVK